MVKIYTRTESLASGSSIGERSIQAQERLRLGRSQGEGAGECGVCPGFRWNGRAGFAGSGLREIVKILVQIGMVPLYFPKSQS